MHVLEAALVSNLSTPARHKTVNPGVSNDGPTRKTRGMLTRLLARWLVSSGAGR